MMLIQSFLCSVLFLKMFLRERHNSEKKKTDLLCGPSSQQELTDNATTTMTVSFIMKSYF